ncbi:MAG TPA: bifunctional diaminohydroxyphosphoribosylaminopyrimidine deaminase/5-amino-6-(5-phosphoribosylamino)uracil reductase RibD [Alphaproteobacteria bacterium]|nr:bifunctional diaminohydroxyphosphoribosylaminopyrimidine deaminase/5-amino-6-(5-phosphoribosylamino)uracil reductase RibD [Alphaproteobacteria bacterium]
MRAALALARRGLGRVWPNPSVGCVVVAERRVVGRGWTSPGGRPHAETEALMRAGSSARGATVYVSLEPCCHHGRTPPCSKALISAGVARVVAPMVDPDPRVNGAGFAALRAAGIAVEVGVGAEEARELNRGFFLRLGEGRPLVTLKTATTLDGRIATHSGQSQWITGALARARAHLLRAQHDAVMIGAGTAIADDPLLTCRLPGLGAASPVRILVDPRLRLPLTSALVRTARQIPTWVLALASADATRRAAFTGCGVEIIDVPMGKDDRLDATAMLRVLGGRGLTRVLVEGGAALAAALLRERLVDKIAWFRSARLIGGDGVPTAAAFGIDRLTDAPAFVRQAIEPCGEDVLETYARAE